MNYLIGIDIGTTSTKTVLFDLNGNTVASHTITYPLYQERDGYAEQDPYDWANASIEGVIAVCKDIDASAVAGIGLSGQMHGLVMLDKTGKVLRKSIIWCDGRTESEVPYITEKVGAENLIEITANPAMTAFTASKICWIQKNEKDIWDKCAHILLPKDYVRYILTGELATDVSDASGMGLMDIKNRTYSKFVCDKLNIPMDRLPKLYESACVTGTLRAEIAKKTGLKQSTIVVGGAGDQAAAAMGTGIVCQGVVSDTLGTSGVVFASTDKPLIDPQGRVHTFCHAVRNKWHIMGVTQGCGLSMQWSRDNLSGGMSYEDIGELASCVKAGSDNLIFLPYLMGERTPHLDSSCRGMFFGLSNIHTKKHLLRSVYEGITFSQMDCLEIIRSLDVCLSEVRVGGGGAKSEFWRQMLADVFKTQITTVNSTEGGALGVALLAGVGAGIYKDEETAVADIIKVTHTQHPQDVDYTKNYEIYKKLYAANKDLFKMLSNN